MTASLNTQYYNKLFDGELTATNSHAARVQNWPRGGLFTIVITGAAKCKMQYAQADGTWRDCYDGATAVDFTTESTDANPHTYRLGADHGYFDVRAVSYDMTGGNVTVIGSPSGVVVNK